MIPEWTSELIADDLYPSLPRKVAKLLNRTFRSVNDLEVYRTAVADWISRCNSMGYMQRIIAVNAAKYDIPVTDVERLYAFLHGFALRQVMPHLRSVHLQYHHVTELVVDQQSWRNSDYLYPFKGRGINKR